MRNSSTGMPPAPTSSVRFGLNASAKAAIPGKASAGRPLLTSIAVSVRPAFTTKSTSRLLEEPPQERRLVHPREQEHVTRDGGLDEGVPDRAHPPAVILHKRSGPRVAAMEEEALERPAERLPHLRRRPVGQMEDLEAAGQALREPALDQERRRSEQHHLEQTLGPGVFVPQPLDRLRPAGGFLHFVEHEDGTPAAPREPCRLPLLRDPLRPAQGRLIGAGEHDRQPRRLDNLLHQRGLADLPRPGHHVDEPSGLRQATGEEAAVRAPVGRCRFTHSIEYFYSGSAHPD